MSGLPPSRLGAAEAQSRIGGNAFTSLWAPRAVNQFHTASISSDGNFIAMVSGVGMISLWHANGAQAWSRRVPGATRCVVSAQGERVIAFTQLDPTQTMVTFLNGSSGAVITRIPLDGAVWGAAVSADGSEAGILTGNRSLYLYTLKPRLAPHQVSLNGIGNTVAFSSDGAMLATGTWNNSGVTCYDSSGGALWQNTGTADPPTSLASRSFEAQMSGNGRFVLGLSYANARQSSGVIYLWRTKGAGRPLWFYRLAPEASRPRVMIAANGQFIAVNYLYRITRGDQSVVERRLLMLDGSGQQICPEKGGPLFSPVLVAVAPDGQGVTVTDGDKTLYHINTSGPPTVLQHLQQVIRQTVSSVDGRLLLVYTGDGTIHLFKLN